MFGVDQAHPQVTPAVTRSKSGAMALRATRQRVPATAVGPVVFEAPGLQQSMPSSPSPTRVTTPSLMGGATPRPGKQATSAEHPRPLAPMISRVAETLRSPSRLAQHQMEDARLGPVGGRLRGDGDRQTPEGTANYVLDDNGLLWNAPPAGEPKLAIPESAGTGGAGIGAQDVRPPGSGTGPFCRRRPSTGGSQWVEMPGNMCYPLGLDGGNGPGANEWR